MTLTKISWDCWVDVIEVVVLWYDSEEDMVVVELQNGESFLVDDDIVKVAAAINGGYIL